MVKVTHKNIRNLSKIISVLVIFILLSSVLFPAVSSTGILTRNKEETNNNMLSKKIFNMQTIREKIKDRLDQTKENIIERLNTLKDRVPIKETNTPKGKSIRMSSGSSLLTSLRAIVGLKTSTTSINFHTNYKGHKEDTPLKLFSTTEVDVDGDGDSDINARLLLYPSIVQPFALSINFRLSIERLSNFNDKDADFEAYAEFYMPGSLIAQSKDDRVRFGYHSEDDEEIPGNCIVTYRFLPYLFFKQKPETRVAIDPRGSAGKLDLIFSLADMNNSKMKSQMSLDVTYDPIVKSEISIGNTADLEGKNLKIESSGRSNVALYLSFEKDDGSSFGGGIYVEALPKDVEFEYDLDIKPLSEGTSFEYEQVSQSSVNAIFFIKNGIMQQFLGPGTNFYIKYIPRHFGFTSKLLGMDGWIEADSFAESIDEIGWCEDIFSSVKSAKGSKVYLADLPTVGRVEWDLNFVGESKLDVFVDTMGTSFNGHLVGDNGGVCDFVVSTNSNIDFTAEWDISQGYFSMDRTGSEINLDLTMHDCLDSLDILEFSAVLQIFDDAPFEIDASGFSQGSVADGIRVTSACNLVITKLRAVIKDYLLLDLGITTMIDELEIDLRSISFDLDKDRAFIGSITIIPIIPRLCEYLEGIAPLVDSSYVSISISRGCHILVGSADVNIYSKEIEIPEVNITSPDEGDILSGVITVSGTSTRVNPSRPIEYVQVRARKQYYASDLDRALGNPSYENSPWENASGTSSWSYIQDTSVLSDGIYKIEAKCYDGTYWSFKDSVLVGFDNIILNITSHENGDTVNGIITISGIAQAVNPIELVQVKISDSPWENATGTSSWSYVWDTTTGPNGNYGITVKCTDVEGLSDSIAINVVVDNGPVYNRPTVRIDYPSFEFPPLLPMVSGNVTIEGIASHGYSGRPVQQVQIKLIPVVTNLIFDVEDSIEWINVSGTTSWSFEWNTLGIPFGVYAIKARSFDGLYYSEEPDMDPTTPDPACVFVIVNNTGLIADSFVFEIHREKSSVFELSEFNLYAENTKLDSSKVDMSLSFDDFYWGTSEKDAHFQAVFNKKDHSVTVTRTNCGSTMELRNVLFEVHSDNANVTVRVNEVVLDNSGPNDRELNFQWLINNQGGQGSGEISIRCSVELSRGLEITGIYLSFNNFSFGGFNIHLVGPLYREFGLNISYEDVTWDIAQDFSYGWIRIGGNGHLFVDVDLEEYRGDELIFALCGVFYFENGDDLFEIAWETVEDDRKTIFVDGSASMSITDFSLIAVDFIDISIPIVTGGFSVHIDGTLAGPGSEHLLSDGSGEVSLYIDEAQGGGSGGGGISLNMDLDIDLSQLLGFACSFTLTEADIYLGASGQISGEAIVQATFDESGITSFTCTGDGEVSGEVYADGYVKIDNLDVSMDDLTVTVNQIIVYGRGRLSITADAGINGSMEGLSADANIAGGAYVGAGVEFIGASLSTGGLTVSVGLLGLYLSGSLGVTGVIEFELNETLEINLDAGVGGSFTVALGNVGGSAGSLSFVLGSASLTISGSAHIIINGNVVDINGIGVGLSVSIGGLEVTGPKGSFWIGYASFGVGGFLADLSLSYLYVGFYGSVTNMGCDYQFDNAYVYANLGYASGSGSFAMGGGIYVLNVSSVVVNDLEGSVSFENDEYIIEGSIDVGGGGDLYVYYSPNKWIIDIQGGGSVGVTNLILEAKNKFRVTMPSAQLSGSVTIEGSSTSKYLKIEGDIYLGADIYATFIPQQLTIGISVHGQIDGDVKVSWTGTSPKLTSVRLQSTNGLYVDPYRNLVITINGEEFLNWNVDLDRNFDFHADQIFYDSDNELVGFHLTIDCSTTRTGTITIIQEYSIIITSGGQLIGDIGFDWSSYSENNKEIQIYSNTGLDFTFPSLEIQISGVFIGSIEFSPAGLNPGDLTIKWGYISGANCARIETNSGFGGYMPSVSINNEVVFEIDITLTPGSYCEYRYYPSYERTEILIDGSLTVDVFRTTLIGQDPMEISFDLFEGTNAQFIFYTHQENRPEIKFTGDFEIGGLDWTGPFVTIEGALLDMSGDFHCYIYEVGDDWWHFQWNTQNGFGASIGFESMVLGQFPIRLYGELNLNPLGSEWCSCQFCNNPDSHPEGWKVLTADFGLENDPAIEHFLFEVTVFGKGFKIEGYDIWADSFWVIWYPNKNWKRPFWQYIGAKWGEQPLIYVKETPSSSWDLIWPIGDQAPVADAGGPYSGTEGQSLQVDGGNSYSPDDETLEYRWNFGDNTGWSSWSQNHLKTHVYNNDGTYTVTLEVREDGDILPQDDDTTTATISDVTHPPNTPETPSGGPAGEGNVGTSYEFNTRTTDPDNDDVRYGWDWDGDYVVDQWTDYWSSGARVWTSHTWYSPGTYNVRVKAEDVCGEQSSFSNPKTVIISDSGSPEWVTPNGHYPSDGWINEVNARDDNEATYAESDPPYHNGLSWKWTDFIELTITPNIDCSKIRYNADYHSSYIRKIDVDVYRTDINNWHNVYNGPFTDSNFQEKSLGGTYPVSKARIRFEIKGCLSGTTAEFYEFDFWKIP